MCIYTHIYIYSTYDMLADLCARAACVCWYKCTGCATKKAPLREQPYFLRGATRALAPTHPCGPRTSICQHGFCQQLINTYY